MYKLFIIFIIFGYYQLLFSQDLRVTSISPNHNAIIDTSQNSITISFNAPIDTNNLKNNIRVLGSFTALRNYNYSLTNHDSSLRLVPKDEYYFGEKVTVILSNSLQGSTGENFSGFQWEFNIKPSKKTYPFFNQPIIYHQFSGYQIIHADINDDNYPDLILDSGQILENDGTGNFTLFQQIQTGGNIATNVTDLDYDGYKELMTGYAVYEQRNDGYFYPDTTLEIAQTDFNNDGFFDYIGFGVIPPGDTINFIGITYSDGTGGFYSEIDTIVIDKNIVGTVNASDFNNDGIRDIAYVTNIFATPYGLGGENKLKVLYLDVTGDTSNSFVIHHDQFPGGDLGYLFQLEASDFNNDNYQDIFLVTNAEDLITYNDMAGGFFTGINDYQNPGGGDLYHFANISDINGDSWYDIIYNYVIGANERAGLLYNKNDSSKFNFRQDIYYKDWTETYNSTVADFNDDGALDIASTWYDGLYIHFNNNINGIEQKELIQPVAFSLNQNYPNPFNSNTKIEFKILEAIRLRIKIFNLNGKEVKTFKIKKYLPGKYYLKWDGKNNFGKEVSSGLYFWHFESTEYSLTKKILLNK